jgi:hypothetical protein
MWEDNIKLILKIGVKVSIGFILLGIGPVDGLF